MGYPEYKSPKNRVWNWLGSTLQEFKVMLLGYRSYTALLSQTGTDAPTAIVLENTLQLNPTYFYNGEGAYHIEDLSGLFTTNKTLVLAQGTGSGVISININDTTIIEIGCNNINGGLTQDGLLLNAAFEIRVYN